MFSRFGDTSLWPKTIHLLTWIRGKIIRLFYWNGRCDSIVPRKVFWCKSLECAPTLENCRGFASRLHMLPPTQRPAPHPAPLVRQRPGCVAGMGCAMFFWANYEFWWLAYTKQMFFHLHPPNVVEDDLLLILTHVFQKSETTLTMMKLEPSW